MDSEVIVEIPVSPEAAAILQDPRKARAIGQLINDFMRPSNLATDLLARLIAEIKAEARANGLTDADIDAELATYNAENRH